MDPMLSCRALREHLEPDQTFESCVHVPRCVLVCVRVRISVCLARGLLQFKLPFLNCLSVVPV